MPSLDDFMDELRKCAEYHGVEMPERLYEDAKVRARKRWPGERIYLVPPTSQKDPEKVKNIVEMAKRLGSGVVSARLGVSRQLVSYHLKKSKNPAA